MKMTKTLLFGVSVLLLSLTACSAHNKERISDLRYEHIVYSSTIEKENCLLCGDSVDHEISAYIGQNNIGLVDINTFEFVPVEINRYDTIGQLIEEPTGVMKMGSGTIGTTRVSLMTDVDRGYSHAQIRTDNAEINEDALTSYLCQDCLDTFSSFFSKRDKVLTIAVINLSARTIRPLVETCPWFSSDDYLVNCSINSAEEVDLQIVFRPVRYLS